MSVDERNEVMMQVEYYERDVVSRLEPGERELLFDSRVKSLGHEVRNIEYLLEQERQAGHLTPEGVRARGAKLAGKVAAVIAEVEKQRGVADAKLGELRKRALTGMEPHPDVPGGWVHPPPLEMTPERMANHREQRDIVRAQLASGALTQADLDFRYMQAKVDGGDADFVAAVEGAPKAFPLISNETRRRAEDMMIEASPLKAAIERLRFARDQHALITDRAKARLQELGWDGAERMEDRLARIAKERGRS